MLNTSLTSTNRQNLKINPDLLRCQACAIDIAELRELPSYDEMELDMPGDQRTAMFVIISDTDEPFKLDGDKCTLQLRGGRPFLSSKFDIISRRRYRELSDYDKKNAFDVEGYLEHRLKLQADNRFDWVAHCNDNIEVKRNIDGNRCFQIN